MSKIESGTYYANAALTPFPSVRALDVTFVSALRGFVAIVPTWENATLLQNPLYLTYADSYNVSTDVYAVSIVYDYSTGLWQSEAYRTLIIPQDTTVSDALKAWFDENFVLQAGEDSGDDPGELPELTGEASGVYIKEDGRWVKKDAYQFTDGQWEKISSTEPSIRKVSITLVGDWIEYDGLNPNTYVKFGSMPTSNDDYDYMIAEDSPDPNFITPSHENPITVPAVAYVWGFGCDHYADEIWKDSPWMGSSSYTDAVRIDLEEGDVLVLICDYS